MELIKSLTSKRQFRYLMVGGINTAFSYFLVVVLHHFLYTHTNMIVIGIITNIIAILFSFTTQKLFVFRTKGNWLKECFRSYIVYGGVALINVAGLWLLVDMMNVSIWLAPLIAAAFCFILTYFLHTSFTFHHRDQS